ncbi:MAG TPA: hypothetical protein DCS55_15840 [Acidimicrobiaceae bacterium]|nr:hypothetical protein [Acidimicrobiaceae bacterium]
MALTTPTPTLPPDEAPPDGAARSRGVWGPFVVAAAALVLAALLNADELQRTAERQPVGWERDVLIDLAAVPQEVADASRLNRPRRWAEALLGTPDPGGSVLERPAPPPARPPVSSDDPVTGPTGSSTSTSTSTSASTSTSTTVPERRTPTASAPLQVAVLGDSMMQVLGQSIVNGAAGDDRVETTLEYRVSTGLTRPDYFDWPGRITELLSSGPLDAVVVMFGANDAQGMVLPAGSEPFGTQAWLDEYRWRVAWVMDALAAGGADAYWVGQPVMRSDSFSARMAALNEIYASEAARREHVTYVDAWSVLSADGAYASHLDDGSGPTSVRQSDGIHLSRAGGDRLAAVVLDEIRADWRLDR